MVSTFMGTRLLSLCVVVQSRHLDFRQTCRAFSCFVGWTILESFGALINVGDPCGFVFWNPGSFVIFTDRCHHSGRLTRVSSPVRQWFVIADLLKWSSNIMKSTKKSRRPKAFCIFDLLNCRCSEPNGSVQNRGTGAEHSHRSGHILRDQVG